jgi:hypothetical protein
MVYRIDNLANIILMKLIVDIVTFFNRINLKVLQPNNSSLFGMKTL